MEKNERPATPVSAGSVGECVAFQDTLRSIRIYWPCSMPRGTICI